MFGEQHVVEDVQNYEIYLFGEVLTTSWTSTQAFKDSGERFGYLAGAMTERSYFSADADDTSLDRPISMADRAIDELKPSARALNKKLGQDLCRPITFDYEKAKFRAMLSKFSRGSSVDFKAMVRQWNAEYAAERPAGKSILPKSEKNLQDFFKAEKERVRRMQTIERHRQQAIDTQALLNPQCPLSHREGTRFQGRSIDALAPRQLDMPSVSCCGVPAIVSQAVVPDFSATGLTFAEFFKQREGERRLGVGEGKSSHLLPKALVERVHLSANAGDSAPPRMLINRPPRCSQCGHYYKHLPWANEHRNEARGLPHSGVGHCRVDASRRVQTSQQWEPCSCEWCLAILRDEYPQLARQLVQVTSSMLNFKFFGFILYQR